MGSRLTEVVVDCDDPFAQAAFWTAVLGYHVVYTQDGDLAEIAAWEREPEDLAQQLRQAPGVPTLVFLKVPEGKTVKNRLHLDVRPVGSYEAELERLIELGARRVDIGQGDVPWTVLADPEGNEFCLLGSLEDLPSGT